MIDILAALELVSDLAERQSPAQTIADARTLYALYQSVSDAGKLDIGGMIKAGTLQGEVDAIARTSALASAVLKDPAHAPALLSLLGSIG